MEKALKTNTSVIDILDYLFEEERIFKDETSLVMRTNVAGFPYKKTLQQFDFAFQPSIDKSTIDELGKRAICLQ